MDYLWAEIGLGFCKVSQYGGLTIVNEHIFYWRTLKIRKIENILGLVTEKWSVRELSRMLSGFGNFIVWQEDADYNSGAFALVAKEN